MYSTTLHTHSNVETQISMLSQITPTNTQLKAITAVPHSIVTLFIKI